MTNLEKVASHAKSAEKVWSEAYDVLWRVIKEKGLRTGVEIGVAFGGHSERILQKTSCKLYCVDPYRHFPDYDDPMNMSNQDFQNLYMFTKKRLSKFGQRCKILRTSSHDAIKRIKEQLDFVYLDGDHSYDGVMYDVTHWYDKLADGGVISGHDYGHPSFPSVKEIVDKYFGRLSLKVHVSKNSVWWVQKKTANISYIMPAYNSEKTIEQSVKSVLTQNFNLGDEIIIVDDKSTDNTLSVILRLAKNNKNIRIYRHSTNRGGGAARNTAIKHSKNTLVFCLDTDNLLIKNSVSKLLDYFMSTTVDGVCFSRVKFIDNNNNVKLSWKYFKNSYTVLDHLFLNRIPSSSGNYLYTKKAWRLVGGYPETAHALDTWAFGLKLAGAKLQIHVYPDLYYLHRLDSESYWNRTAGKYDYFKIASQEMSRYANSFPYIFRVYFNLSFRGYNWFTQLGKKNLFSSIYANKYSKDMP